MQKRRLKNPALPIESIARQPDHLRLMDAQFARGFKLLPQLMHIHNLAQQHIMRPVHQRERRPRPGKMLPDKLQHQQLVEVRIEQRPRNRIELPVVVVRAPGQVDDHVPAILLNAALIFSDRDNLSRSPGDPANPKTTAHKTPSNG